MQGVVDDPPLHATWVKYLVLARYVAELPVRLKRHAFLCMRKTDGATSDLFIPLLGVTAGEFCIFHALAQEGPRRAEPAATCGSDRPAAGAGASADAA